jgi:hypothetical protein
MASRPKRTLQKPQRFADEFVVSNIKERVKRPKKDNNLYEVEIKEVDQENKRVCIHFKGYDSQFDEWRPYDREGEYFPFILHEKQQVLTTMSLVDRADHFIDVVYRGIKRNLNSGRKDDPDVRLEIDVSEDVFTRVFGSVAAGVMERGRLIYTISSNRVLDDILGQKWDERIVNIRGDYCFVIEGIVEYKVIGGKCVKTEIEDCSQLVFTFVKNNGNSVQYKRRH